MVESSEKNSGRVAKPGPLDGHFDYDMEELAHALGLLLGKKKARLVAAESCTGGWLSAAVTSVPGSSNWFALGLSTYSNEAKMDLLGVPRALLKRHGAVSLEVVQSMAEGALKVDPGALLAVSISGFAGPGTDSKVGTVCVAWMLRGQPAVSRKFVFSGERNQVRRASVCAALRGCIQTLS